MEIWIMQFFFRNYIFNQDERENGHDSDKFHAFVRFSEVGTFEILIHKENTNP